MLPMILGASGIGFLALAAWGLLDGRFTGLYGSTELRSSAFYWLIAGAYLLLGCTNLVAAARLMLR